MIAAREHSCHSQSRKKNLRPRSELVRHYSSAAASELSDASLGDDWPSVTRVTKADTALWASRPVHILFDGSRRLFKIGIDVTSIEKCMFW